MNRLKFYVILWILLITKYSSGLELNDESYIKCDYIVKSTVECKIDIFNPDRRDDFEEIEGELPPDTSFDNVTVVSIFYRKTTIIPSIICSTFPNLNELSASGSGITNLFQHTFENCPNLETLILHFNEIQQIPDNVFSNLKSLHHLNLIGNRINKISPRIFNGLENLQELTIAFNFISEIPQETFKNLSNLTFVVLTSNNIARIDSNSFGSVSKLETFSVDHNQIFEIDESFFNKTANLKMLGLIDNFCVDENFYNFDLNREEVRDKLKQCFVNFVAQPPVGTEIECFYDFDVSSNYLCELSLTNPTGYDDFRMIIGPHVGSRKNEDVKVVSAFYQDSPNIPPIICQQFPNLVELSMPGCELTNITSKSFEHCNNLATLILHFNNIAEIPDESFSNLKNLHHLDLIGNKIDKLTLKTFTGLDNLQELTMAFNSVAELADGTFNDLPKLNYFVITSNKLTSLNSKSFGNSLKSLQLVSVDHNKIDEIDPLWFEGAEKLDSLFLYNNLCSNRYFLNISTDRKFVATELQTCFDNFDKLPNGTEISCLYERLYTCNLMLRNPTGFDEFRRIKGEQLEGVTYDGIEIVSGYGQISKIIPKIICKQFKNLKVLWIIDSNIEVIGAAAFENCGNLEELSLKLNHIVKVKANVLPKTLKFVDFGYNWIDNIHEDAFEGLKLLNLYLSFNSLQEIKSSWLTSSRESLQIFSMKYNKIASIPIDTFLNFTSLKNLAIDHNQLTTINSTSFGGSAMNLETFVASHNQINSVDPRFFESAVNLIYLDLQKNLCVDQKFTNVDENREHIKQQLSNCFDNF